MSCMSVPIMRNADKNRLCKTFVVALKFKKKTCCKIDVKLFSPKLRSWAQGDFTSWNDVSYLFLCFFSACARSRAVRLSVKRYLDCLWQIQMISTYTILDHILNSLHMEYCVTIGCGQKHINRCKSKRNIIFRTHAIECSFKWHRMTFVSCQFSYRKNTHRHKIDVVLYMFLVGSILFQFICYKQSEFMSLVIYPFNYNFPKCEHAVADFADRTCPYVRHVFCPDIIAGYVSLCTRSAVHKNRYSAFHILWVEHA